MSHNEFFSLEMLRDGTGAGGSRRGRRPTRGAPPGDPRRHRLSESVAKKLIQRASGRIYGKRYHDGPPKGYYNADVDFKMPPETTKSASSKVMN